MKVFVIMGNDFPCAVRETEAEASNHVAVLQGQDKQRGLGPNRIRYYVEEFETRPEPYREPLVLGANMHYDPRN